MKYYAWKLFIIQANTSFFPTFGNKNNKKERGKKVLYLAQWLVVVLQGQPFCYKCSHGKCHACTVLALMKVRFIYNKHEANTCLQWRGKSRGSMWCIHRDNNAHGQCPKRWPKAKENRKVHSAVVSLLLTLLSLGHCQGPTEKGFKSISIKLYCVPISCTVLSHTVSYKKNMIFSLLTLVQHSNQTN